MKKTQFVFASLIFSLPAAVIAQQPDSKMSQDMNMSPASKEYMSGMQKMHSGMMNAMKEQDADRAFARGMIEHHKGAIAMAETELKYGKDPEMKKMAEDIIKAQKGEIEHMETWLKK
ncbi:CopM family metallochaperone [Pantoea endophytica]